MTPDGSGRSTHVFFGHALDLPRPGEASAPSSPRTGGWEGRRLLPRRWVRDATGGSSQALNAAYGLLWWVNRKGPVRARSTRTTRGCPRGSRASASSRPGHPLEVVRRARLRRPGRAGRPLRSETVVVRLGGPGDPQSRDYTFHDATRVLTEILKR